MRLSPEDRAYLDERYGVNNKFRWPVYVVSVLVAAFVVWMAWAYWAEIHPKVTSGETNYNLNSQGSLAKGTLASTVTFQVIRANKSVHATCTVQALAKDHSVIGQLTDKAIPMSAPTNTTITWSIPTYRSAFAINWIGCTAPGQNTAK